MSSSTCFSEKSCVICRCALDSGNDDISQVKRGINSLIEYSIKYNDKELHEYLESMPAIVMVHNGCRKSYTSKRRFEQMAKKEFEPEEVKPKSLRSCSLSFNWRENCFLCGNLCDFAHTPKDIRHVETLEMRSNLLNLCNRRTDLLAHNIKTRLLMCCDLVAEEAIYHRHCHNTFTKSKLYSQPGRPIDSSKRQSFEKLCEWLEMTDNELLTLGELTDKARSLTDDGIVYSEKRLQEMLIEKYGDHIFFGEKFGRKNVVCWKEMASYVINQKWYDDRKADVLDDSKRIIVAAAKLIKASIREATYTMDEYPSNESIRNSQSARDWIPPLLQVFLDNLVNQEIRKIALGNVIVQSVRPRSVIAPILFGIGVSMDHVFASKWLINILYRLGFSVSYDEVSRFKQSVANSDSFDLPDSYPSSFTQFAADNVDHDICTLDGLGTFHGMGIISMTSAYKSHLGIITDVPIQRLNRTKVAEVVRRRCIPLLQCNLSDRSILSNTVFTPQLDLQEALTQYYLPPSIDLDLLWHISWFAHDIDDPRPSWAGFMSSMSNDTSGSSADIRMLPIIDVNPNDYSCIYSTLIFIERQAKNVKVVTPCVTFDQPLWLKAVEIIMSEKLNIVCRLGPFHMQMSMLGSLGRLMSGSGLTELFECCYGTNTVKHIMTGKAVARATRAHFLVESALNTVLLKSCLDNPAADFSDGDLAKFRELSNIVLLNGWTDSMFCSELCDVMHKATECISQLSASLRQQSRTARLWLLYIKYVSILKQFIRAERLGDWRLHLKCVSDILNLFAATGHNNYAKSGRLYLESMLKLPENHPELYDFFLKGGHVIRRSGKFWAGLSSDLAIEQCMMRALKTRGGLTHGRGLTDSVRLTWVATVHKCATVHSSLAALADLEYCHDDLPHHELGKARVKRDNSDLMKILEHLKVNSPFDVVDSTLHSISSGITADEADNINCDMAEEVGCAIMKKLDGVKFSEIVMKKADQIKTLADVACTLGGIGKKSLSIDSGLLFSRLLIIMQRTADMKRYFSFELTPQPAALFKDLLLRKSDKSVLRKELVKGVFSSNSSPQAINVIDGGYLLHVVKWSPDSTYEQIAQQYVSYVNRHYGSTAVVVFDGYCSGPSIKDNEHQRRATSAGPNIAFDPHKIAYRNQSAFLSNDCNKMEFVNFLTNQLQSAQHSVYQAENDADTLIVKCALEIALHTPVTVVANDTDVFILLLYHFLPRMCDVLMLCGTGKRALSCQTTIPIRAVYDSLDKSVVKLLLVIHAISGCDTTSYLYGHGKAGVLRKLSRSAESVELVKVIESYEASPEEIMVAGCKLVQLIYAGHCSTTLNHLRYVTFMNLTASSNQILRPERLPPTENATRYHVYRVHLQVLLWKSLMSSNVQAEQWGWMLKAGKYVPITTDIEIAPPDILNIVRCKCRCDSRNPCGTSLCSCRKHGMLCVASCKNCNGSSCQNKESLVEVPNDDSDERGHDDDDDDDDDVGALDEVNRDVFDEEEMEYYMPWVCEEVVC